MNWLARAACLRRIAGASLGRLGSRGQTNAEFINDARASKWTEVQETKRGQSVMELMTGHAS